MRQRDRISSFVGGAALGLAVLAIGGAPRWSVVALTLLAAAGVAAQLRSRRRFDRLSPMLALLAIATGLTALQVVPLPSGLLATVNPAAYELIANGAAARGAQPPSLLPLSLDPPNTRRALMELAAYLALAWVALRLAASEQGRRRTAAAVVIVISGAAVLGLLHQIGHATRLYGVYTPLNAGRPLIMGPLLNPNSYGGLLAMGAILAAGLALHGTQPARQRLLWAGLGALSLAVSLLTQSRGAAVALLVGLTVLGIVIAMQRWRDQGKVRRPPDLLRVTVPAVFVVLSVLALVVYLSAAGVSAQLGRISSNEIEAPLSKFGAWRSAAALIEESPVVGVGRGGFESSFTRVHSESAVNTFSHAENAYLQSVLDWGVPGALALAATLAWMILAVSRRWSGGPLAAGAIGALAAIAAQSTVDLGLELPGVAVPVIAITSLLTYVPLTETPARLVKRQRVMRAAAVAALLLAALLVALPWGRTLADDRRHLRALSTPSLAEAHRLMQRHPMDYLAPAEGARALLRTGRTSDGITLLNHALALHPTHPDLHLLAARALLLAGKPGQARIEYVLALRGRRNPTALVKEVVAAYPAAAEAAAALPADAPDAMTIANALTRLSRNDVALHYLARAAEAHPLDARYQEQLAEVAAEQKDDSVAESAAKRRVELTPTLAARLAYARILQRRGKLADAEIVLRGIERAGGTVDDQITARVLQCDIYQGQGNPSRARDCFHAVLGLPALRVRTRRDIHRRLAPIEEALGNTRRAEWERREAERP